MGLAKTRVLQYKVVETSTVHDTALENILNDWVARGWQYDGMQFAIQPAQRRPTMAFILFTRERELTREELEAERDPGEGDPGERDPE